MGRGVLRQLVFDMETLSTREDAVILSFGCVVYDLENDAKKSLEELARGNMFYCKLDVKGQVEGLGRVIDQDTLDWWRKQGQDAQDVLRPSKEDVDPRIFLGEFDEWIQEVGYEPRWGIAWQRGTVDIAWLDSLCRQLGQKHSNERSIQWGRIRDIRTAVDALGYSKKFNGIPNGFDGMLAVEFPGMIKHHAGHDCIAQVLQLRMCDVFPKPKGSTDDDDIPF